MKQLFIVIILFFCISQMNAQISLNGVISVQNSKTETGKTELVPNAQVECDKGQSAKAQPKTSDSEGKFTLEVDGEKNMQIAISVIPKGKYQDYVVVNEYKIKDITLGQLRPVGVYICKKEDLDKRRGDMVGINWQKQKEPYEKEIRKLQAELKILEDNNDYFNSRIKEIEDNIKLIESDKNKMLERIKEYAQALVKVNLDEADNSYILAYNCFARGELDSVKIYLPYSEIEKELKDGFKQRNDAKEMKVVAQNINEAAQIEDERGLAKIKNGIEKLEMLAKTADIERQYDVSNEYYIKLQEIYESLVVENKQYYTDLALVLYKLGNNYGHYNYKLGRNEYQQNLQAAEKKYFEAIEKLDSIEDKLTASKIETDVLENLGLIQYLMANSYSYDSATTYYLKSIDTYNRIIEKDSLNIPRKIVDVLESLGHLYYSMGFQEQADECFIKCLNYCRQITAMKPELVESWIFYIEMIISSGHLTSPEVEKHFTLCLQAIEPFQQIYYIKGKGDLYCSIGKYYRDYKGDYLKAEEYLIKSNEIFKQLTDEKNNYSTSLAYSLKELAKVYVNQKKYVEAENCYVESYEIYKKRADSNKAGWRIDASNTIRMLGELCEEQKEYSKAEKYYLQALNTYKEYLPLISYGKPDMKFIYETLHKLGSNSLRQKEFEKSLEYYNEWLDLFKKENESDHYCISVKSKIYYDFALIYSYQEKKDEVKKYLSLSKNTMEELSKKNDYYLYDFVELIHSMGWLIYNWNENKVESENHFLQALNLMDDLYSKKQDNYSFKRHSFNIAYYYYSISSFYYTTENYTKAKEILLKSQKIYEQYKDLAPQRFIEEIQPVLHLISFSCRRLTDYQCAFSTKKYQQDLLKKYKNVADNYNNKLCDILLDFSYLHFYTNELNLSEKYLKEAKQINSSGYMVKATETLIWAFQGKIKSIESLYNKLCQSQSEECDYYKKVCLLRFDEFEKAGIISEARKADVEKIRKMLKQ